MMGLAGATGTERVLLETSAIFSFTKVGSEIGMQKETATIVEHGKARVVPVVDAVEAQPRSCLPTGGLLTVLFGPRQRERRSPRSLSPDAQDAANRFGI